jgi:ABC-type uncharacterized transport system substrate-binding protein
MEGKRLGLLHELVPKTDLIAVLLNPSNPFFENQLNDLNEASRALGLKIHVERASDEREIAAAFDVFAQQHAGAVLVGADLYFTSRRALVVDPAVELRLPGIYEWREFAEAGGLMSYGTILTEAFRQAGEYVARILKGESPADVPVMQASKFEFVINLKTARQIGIEAAARLVCARRRGDRIAGTRRGSMRCRSLPSMGLRSGTASKARDARSCSFPGLALITRIIALASHCCANRQGQCCWIRAELVSR